MTPSPFQMDPDVPLLQCLSCYSPSSECFISSPALQKFAYQLSNLCTDKITNLCRGLKVSTSGRKNLKMKNYCFGLCQLPSADHIFRELQNLNNSVPLYSRLIMAELRAVSHYLHELQIPVAVKKKRGRPPKRSSSASTTSNSTNTPSPSPVTLPRHLPPRQKLVLSSKITTIPSSSTSSSAMTNISASESSNISSATHLCPPYHEQIRCNGDILYWPLVRYQLDPFYTWHTGLAAKQLAIKDTSKVSQHFSVTEKILALLSDVSYRLVFFFSALQDVYLSTKNPTDHLHPKSKLSLCPPMKYALDSEHSKLVNQSTSTAFHPLDLTSSFTLTPGHHCLNFKLLSCVFSVPTVGVLAIVKKLSIPEIVQSVQKRTISIEQRRAQLLAKTREQFPSKNKERIKQEDGEEDGDSMISMNMIKFALTDPWSGLRIALPVRSLYCDHVECFDLATFLLITEKKCQFSCPFCNVPFGQRDLDMGASPLESIRVDLFFLEALSIFPTSSSHAQFDPIKGDFVLPWDNYDSNTHIVDNNVPFSKKKEIIILNSSSEDESLEIEVVVKNN